MNDPEEMMADLNDRRSGAEVIANREHRGFVPGFGGRISAALVWDGTDEVRIPEAMGKPSEGQMVGTARERLVELAGRACYDSLGTGRKSIDYHANIIKINHGALWEHAAITVEFTFANGGGESAVNRVNRFLACCSNRVGLWEETKMGKSTDEIRVRLTTNLRTVREWPRNSRGPGIGPKRYIGDALAVVGRSLAPLVVTDPTQSGLRVVEEFDLSEYPKTVEPETDEEKWATLYLTGSRGWCYDSKTEVLTKDGWKKWPDVTGDEEFATLDVISSVMSYQNATNVIREPYHGKMYRVASQCVDLLVTPNHRMVARKHDTQAARRGEEPLAVYTAEEIAGKRVHYKRTAEWVGESPDYFEIPDVQTQAKNANQVGSFGTRIIVSKGRKVKALAFARFMGYWVAEGSLDHQPGSGFSTLLYQKLGGKAWNGIHECLTEIGFTFNETEGEDGCVKIRVNGGKALYDYLHPFHGSENKAIPADVKSWAPEYQRALIESYLEGDGSNGGGNHAGEGNTVSRQLADDLQEAALKAGWSASIRVVDRRNDPLREGKWASIKTKKVAYVVGFSKLRGQEPLVNHGGKKHDSWTTYSGMVYCATVPNGTLYVRRNGKPCWSGNSHELVRHGDWTAISQRSTRFVDESESEWVMHPLSAAYLKENDDSAFVECFKRSVRTGKAEYDYLVMRLQPWLESKGIDKFSARKQARGAARGLLGNALETQVIFSASVHQWRHMLNMRAADAADAEIRLGFAEAVLPCLRASRYADRFDDFELAPAKDGIGRSIAGGGAK